MANWNPNIGDKATRVLRFLWFLLMQAAALHFAVKSIKLITYSGGMGDGALAAFLFVCALLCSTAGFAPYISRSVDWFSDWFVIGLLWSHARNKEPGDPIDPICRLIDQHRYLEARVGLEKLLAYHPDNHEAIFVLAELLALYMNEDKTALRLLQEYFIGRHRKHKPLPEHIPALLLYSDLAERFELQAEAIRLLRAECGLRYSAAERQQLEARLAAL